MIKNLIFDLDGTLYPESSGLEDECQQRVYDFFGSNRLNLYDSMLWHTIFNAPKTK